MKKVLCFGIALFVLSGCGGGGPQQQASSQDKKISRMANKQVTPEDLAKVDKLLTEGTILFAKGHIPAALKTFDDAIQLNPKDPRGYISLGEAYLKIKKLDPAIDTFQLLLSIAPDNAQANYFLGMAHGLKGERDVALRYAQRSFLLAKDQNNKEVLVRAATLLKGLNQAEQTTDGK